MPKTDSLVGLNFAFFNFRKAYFYEIKLQMPPSIPLSYASTLVAFLS
jgi:hypothetical protein